MDTTNLRQLLQDVQEGRLNVEAALTALRDLPYKDLGFARVDHHRPLRQGLPEVIYCPGKTTSQIVEIAREIAGRHSLLLATRATKTTYHAIQEVLPASEYYPLARLIALDQRAPTPPSGRIAVVSGGTSDLPVAEEAAVTASLCRHHVERFYDVGVAGIHRLLDVEERLRQARVIIVVAGMEGALASVVGGLVAAPVIAVPTSVGYGASFGGLAALLTMLNSCAAGVGVVNIDNGFGAAILAHTILQAGRRDE